MGKAWEKPEKEMFFLKHPPFSSNLFTESDCRGTGFTAMWNANPRTYSRFDEEGVFEK